MIEVSSAQVSESFGTYREMAEGSLGSAEPVHVMHSDKPSVVIVAAEEYARLKKRDRQVMATEDLPQWLAHEISASEMNQCFAYLDDAD